MKRFKFVFPLMIIVAVLAMWYLGKQYSEVPMSSRILISLCGSIVTGVISFFLFKEETDQIDPKPSDNLKKRK